MKANRHTIPSIVENLEGFVNGSRTLKGIKNPSAISTAGLNKAEKDRLRIDSETAGIQYVILSYDIPVLWVTKSGWTHRVRQEFTQTTERHIGLLYSLPAGYNPVHVVRD